MRVTQTVLDDAARVAVSLADAMKPLAGSTIALTGANGFLIGFLADVLAAWNDLNRHAPVRILAIDNNLTGTADRLAHLQGRPDVRMIAHDVTIPFDADEPIQWIVHGASIASPTVYRRFPLETIDANVQGTRHMLDLGLSQNVRGMLVMSTSEIYGDPDPSMIPTPETYRGNVSCTGPRACYDESKRLAETLVATYHGLHDLRAMCIRPFNVYGPGFRLDDQRVLPDFMSAALERRDIHLLSDGSPTRTFSYMTDAVAAMLLLLMGGKGGEAYNVGNDQGEISMLELARLVARIGAKVMGGTPMNVTFQVSDDPRYLTDNPVRRCPDLTKVKAAIDWRPEVDLATGLERMLLSYRELGLGVDQ